MSNASHQVTIYTKPGCPYCADAKHLLTRKKVSYVEIDISRNPSERAAMIGRAGGKKYRAADFHWTNPCRRL